MKIYGTTQSKSAWEIYFSLLQCFSIRSEYISFLSRIVVNILLPYYIIYKYYDF